MRTSLRAISGQNVPAVTFSPPSSVSGTSSEEG
jgi:hypothetical protein